jgi:predicted metalloendopeptidase
VLSLFFTLALSLITSAQVDQAVATQDQDMDRSIKPGGDFYRYANGGWLKTTTIPTGQTTFDNRTILVERTSKRVRDLIQDAAGANAVRGSITQRVGAYYAAFMDEDGIESKGLTPLADDMARIATITNKASLSAYLGATLNTEVDGLTANSDHIFGVWVNQSFTDSDHYVFHLLQGGLGMPDRDDYLDPSPKMAALRTQYKAHIAAILKLAGIADAETRGARILSLEIQIAQSHAPDSDAADVFKQNNPWKRSDFDVKAPGMDWNAYFSAAGVASQSQFIVWQPSAVIGTSVLVASEEIDSWKDYLRFHLFEHYANVLPKSVAAEDFAFYGTILSERSTAGPHQARHLRHKRRARPGGRPAYATLLPARSQERRRPWSPT